jgi:hypothetical protein
MDKSLLLKLFEVPCASVHLAGPDVLFVAHTDNYNLSKPEFEELLAFYNDYSIAYGPIKLIVEAPNMLSFDMDLWEMIATVHYEKPVFSAVAVLSTSVQHDLMSKNYHRKNEKAGFPSATFRDFETARMWCNTVSSVTCLVVTAS